VALTTALAAAFKTMSQRGEFITGQSCVYWMTQEFNSSARSLYDKIGQRTSFIIYSKK
jgi:hypothetical protein